MEQNTNTNNTQPSTYEKGKKTVKGFFLKLFLVLILIGILGLLGFIGYSSFTYSDGNRAGILIKFSKKGYVFKTYEGEMNLGGINPMPGNTIANNYWQFSVVNDDVALALDTLQGKKLRLHYKEKKGHLFWRGETNYLVDEVVVIP
ncbi:MAG: hypothetical protein IPK18_09610 [Sphingobacteriales bacterium]|nr:MAG: hypothetical protein IPK18_09610 [Sphingobacteriales bacterium]